MNNIENTGRGGNGDICRPSSRDRLGSTHLRAHVDGDTVYVAVPDLRTPESRERFQHRFVEADTCTFDLEPILVFGESDRRTVIRFLVSVERGRDATAYSDQNGRVFDSLQQASLELLEQATDVTRVQQCSDFAVDVAGLCGANETGIRLACAAIQTKLRDKGYRDIRVSQLASQAIAASQERERVADSDEQRSVLSGWPDAPCDEAVRTPQQWRLGPDGITSADGRDAFSCRVLITRIFEDVEGGEFSVELAWSRGSRWLSHTCLRKQIFNVRSVVDLASYGLPVTSNNAGILVDYLADYERKNLGSITTGRIARRLGWFGHEGRDGFLCGHELIRNLEDSGDSGEQREIAFHGADEGDEQIISGIRRSGTLESWIETIAPLRAYPRVLFGIYAALSAPILRIVSAPNYIMSFDGPTSRGKTTAQMVAASCWGYPIINGQDGPSAMFGWDATRVFIERAAAILNGLPLILDDTKIARSRDDVTATIYQFASGKGRGRGSKTGVAATRSWGSVMISSGEDPLPGFARAGGLRARVLALWGSPFGASDEAGQLAVRLRERLEDHFGHAGPALVSYLAANRGLWPQWRNRYRQSRQWYQQQAGANAVAHRMAACFAIIELTAHLVHQAMPLPWQYQNTVQDLWPEITADTDEADQAAAALRYIIAWCYSHRSQFQGQGTPRDQQPSAGWLGRWRLAGRHSDDSLGIYPYQLDRALEERGYSADAIRRHWKERGWLRTEPQKTTLRASIGNEKSPMVAIRWPAIEEQMNGSEAFPPT